MQIASVGIDLGKTTFHLVALDERDKVIIKQKFSRKQLLAYTANLPSALIGIEACSGAHFIGAALRARGHDVRLIAAQFVKPFLKSKKSDFLDRGDRGGGGAPEHTFRAHQDRRAARSASTTSRPRPAGASPYGAGQPDPRIPVGARDCFRARAGKAAPADACRPGRCRPEDHAPHAQPADSSLARVEVAERRNRMRQR